MPFQRINYTPLCMIFYLFCLETYGISVFYNLFFVCYTIFISTSYCHWYVMSREPSSLALVSIELNSQLFLWTGASHSQNTRLAFAVHENRQFPDEIIHLTSKTKAFQFHFRLLYSYREWSLCTPFCFFL